MEFWHVIKIHPIHADKKGQGDENGGKNGQYLHYFVHAVGNAGKINIEHAVNEVTIGIEDVDHAQAVIEDIPEIGLSYNFV